MRRGGKNCVKFCRLFSSLFERKRRTEKGDLIFDVMKTTTETTTTEKEEEEDVGGGDGGGGFAAAAALGGVGVNTK